MIQQEIIFSYLWGGGQVLHARNGPFQRCCGAFFFISSHLQRRIQCHQHLILISFSTCFFIYIPCTTTMSQKQASLQKKKKKNCKTNRMLPFREYMCCFLLTACGFLCPSCFSYRKQILTKRKTWKTWLQQKKHLQSLCTSYVSLQQLLSPIVFVCSQNATGSKVGFFFQNRLGVWWTKLVKKQPTCPRTRVYSNRRKKSENLIRSCATGPRDLNGLKPNQTFIVKLHKIPSHLFAFINSYRQLT